MERILIEFYRNGATSASIHAWVPKTMTDSEIDQWVKLNRSHILWLAERAPTPSLLCIPQGRVIHA